MKYFAQSLVEQYTSQQPDTLNPQDSSGQSGDALSGQTDAALSAPNSATDLLNSSSSAGIKLQNISTTSLSTEFDSTPAPEPSNTPVIIGLVALGVIVGMIVYMFYERRA